VSERDEYPEGFDESCGIEPRFMQAANSALCDMTGNRKWDVPCLAAHILASTTQPSPGQEKVANQKYQD
jgi:hypothetical protein